MLVSPSFSGHISALCKFLFPSEPMAHYSEPQYVARNNRTHVFVLKPLGNILMLDMEEWPWVALIFISINFYPFKLFLKLKLSWLYGHISPPDQDGKSVRAFASYVICKLKDFVVKLLDFNISISNIVMLSCKFHEYKVFVPFLLFVVESQSPNHLVQSLTHMN